MALHSIQTPVKDKPMVDVRVQIPEATLTGLQEKLTSNTRPTDITRDALALYNWAVSERAKGRVLLTTDAQGNDAMKLTMPSLESVKVA